MSTLVLFIADVVLAGLTIASAPTNGNATLMFGGLMIVTTLVLGKEVEYEDWQTRSRCTLPYASIKG